MKFSELVETFKRLGDNKWIMDDFDIDEIRLSRTNDTEEHIVIITKEIDGYGHTMEIPVLSIHCRKENHASRQQRDKQRFYLNNRLRGCFLP